MAPGTSSAGQSDPGEHAELLVMTVESNRMSWAWSPVQTATIKRMALIALIGFIVSILLCIGEVIFERDWPRDTWKFPVMFAVVMALAAAGV